MRVFAFPRRLFPGLLFTWCLVCVVSPLWAAPGDRTLDVYRQWRGDGCRFQASRPFTLIKDIYQLDSFWRSLDTDESMPHIDFSTLMMLAWVPGSTMFDYMPVAVSQFLIEEGRFIIVLEMERKNSGGYWRRPYLLTLLPRVQQGDIFIMRAGRRHLGEQRWIPLYTLYDMDTIRTESVSLTAAAVAAPKPVAGAVSSVGRSGSGVQTAGHGNASTNASTNASATTVAAVGRSQASTSPTGIPLDGSFADKPSAELVAAPGKPDAPQSRGNTMVAAKASAESADDDLFGDLDDDFGFSSPPTSSSAPAREQTQARAQAPARAQASKEAAPQRTTSQRQEEKPGSAGGISALVNSPVNSSEPGAAYPPDDPFGSDFDLEF